MKQQHQQLSRRREDEANARRLKAASFAARWQDKGEAEVGDKASFWDELLTDVFGVQNPRSSGFIEYEKSVESPTVQGKIDGYIASTRVIIEQKSSKTKLNDRTKHGGIYKTPFQQAWDYGSALPDQPNWIVACNFKEFWIWDTRHLDQGYTVVTLEKLSKQWEDLVFLVDASVTAITRREELSVDAALLVDALYDKLKLCYPVEERESDDTAQALNVLCVRLVFCFYAESAGLFGKRGIFRDYLGLYSSEVRTMASFECLRASLLELFRALDKTDDERSADKELHHLVRIKDFPYVNGGLFTAESDIPVFSNDVVAALEECERFNWEGINPTIFGAVFESTLKAKVRRSGGMHYTSIENIHKVIRPLFLDELETKLEHIKAYNVADEREKQLASFIGELGKLTFLDPACGSGNFLSETYIQLCRLEGEAVEAILETAVAPSLVYEGPSIDHFYGIEIDDFAASVAKTAMWIADCQMKRKLRAITHSDEGAFPITAEAHIFKGNALHLDWETMRGAEEQLKNPTRSTKGKGASPKEQLALSFDAVESVEQLEAMKRKIEHMLEAARQGKETPPPPPAPHYRYDYIMGNPPFVGYFLQSDEQKTDLLSVCKDDEGKTLKTAGKIDYVAGWYYKAASFIKGTTTRCAFVSTNSITQGEQVALVWQELFKQGMHIDFAWRSFKWENEQGEKKKGKRRKKAAGEKEDKKGEEDKEGKEDDDHKMAQVHCVIVGFSSTPNDKPKVIYEERQVKTSDGKKQSHVVTMTARSINGYLLDAPCVFVESRKSPLCEGIPEMILGSIPRDGGAFYLTSEERKAAVKKEPNIAKFIKRVVGSDEFINDKERWCLWLVDSTAHDRNTSTLIKKRMSLVREFREGSKRETTKELAKFPFLFAEIRQPSTDYLIVPSVSSANRCYVPVGFLPSDIICTNLAFAVPSATLYHFGVLTSSVHMAWMRAVCGRLGMGYRYSNIVVYNTFVWPDATDEQRAKVEQTAKAILAARANEKGSTLADLYNNTNMPLGLRRAHEANDRAVLAAYGWAEDTQETGIVARLMELYQQKAGG